MAVQATGKPESIFLTSDAPGIAQVEAVYSFSTMDEVYACLRKGYADAIAGHENALGLFLASSPGSYRMLDETLDVSQLGVAFQKDTHQELGPGPHPDPGGDGGRRDHPGHFRALWPGR